MDNKKYGIFSSSADPEKLAATVAGAAKIVGAFVGFLVIAGVIDAADGQVLSENVATIATNIAALMTVAYATYGALQSAYGILRKAAISIGKKV